ncbi:hypothetical protein GQ55_6G031200 [Panicum hallii var. hallii]|uniref:Uncharacterized protein n=1 Tax=Panicum hallii var. hallii TaxID=1504633 RepID=A0A2T7D3A8_9POAL|nr:hypothetical protein GQ55_6G031200 [Panicum hallii var. hallii]
MVEGGLKNRPRGGASAAAVVSAGSGSTGLGARSGRGSGSTGLGAGSGRERGANGAERTGFGRERGSGGTEKDLGCSVAGARRGRRVRVSDVHSALCWVYRARRAPTSARSRKGPQGSDCQGRKLERTTNSAFSKQGNPKLCLRTPPS